MHEWRPMLGQMLRELVASGGMKPQGGGSTKPPPICAIARTGARSAADSPDGWAWSHVHRTIPSIHRHLRCCWFAQMNQSRMD